MITLPSRTIHYAGEGLLVQLTIQKANYQQGLRRTLLIQQILKDPSIIAVSEEVDQVRSIMGMLFYPSMIASVVQHDGFEHWPITLDEFMDLPEELMIQWEEATYELNPSWRPPNSDEEDQEVEKEKKLSTSEE